ncbi:MAG: SIR2 family protein [Candidatus Electrothrix scaldis]|nr:MAG: SIR2 family protein [Candidatus Electrothrix sp. GW3-3]
MKKILILSANPADTNRLRFDKEIREIQQRLKNAKYGRDITTVQELAVNISDLQDALLEHEPDVVHFCGHGEKAGLFVESSSDSSILVPSDSLATLFSLCATHVKCVILNSCHSESLAELIHQYIPFVIGMKKEVLDTAAIEFAGGLYAAVGAGKTIEEAFKFGKNAIELHNLPDHQTPILLKRDLTSHCSAADSPAHAAPGKIISSGSTSSTTSRMPKHTLPQGLMDAHQAGKLIPVVGAGVSMSLKDAEGKNLFPSWKQLLEYAAESLRREDKEKHAIGIAAMLMLDKFQEAANLANEGLTGRLWTNFFAKYIEEPLDKISDDNLSLPKAIWSISNRIITLNYDKVLRAACPNIARLKELDNKNSAGLSEFTNSRNTSPMVWHLHGRTDNISTLIFTAESYRKLYAEADAEYQAALEVFRGICRDNILLFVGCSLEDAELLQEMVKQYELFDKNTGPHYALVREENKAAIEQKIEGIPLKLVTFSSFGEPLLGLIQEIVQPAVPEPTLLSEEPDKVREEEPAPSPVKNKKETVRIVLLSASPLDNEQEYWQLKEFRRIKNHIDHYSLSIANLNDLQGYDYILILTKVVKGKLLIENDYLCSERISFEDLVDNIGNETTNGLFFFVDQLPDEESIAGIQLLTLVFPSEDKKLFQAVGFQLFQKNNLEYFKDYIILNPDAFVLHPLNTKIPGNNLQKEKTPLPDSIDHKVLNGFVGRSDDLKNICRELMEMGEGEILTIKGSGGIGKTHTVKKIAVALADRAQFPGGIHFIDCEPVTDSKLFQFKAATVFGLELAEAPWQHLRDHYDGKERLVIFDNFEPLLHLEDTEKIKEILGKVTDYAKVVVTSREVLGVEAEKEYTIRPMVTDEAVELFQANFTAAENEVELLRQEILSRILDNNPLAIKLITANLPKGKSLEKLKEELEDDLFSTISDEELNIFDSESDRNIDRKRSIYGSILYSYRHLSEQEKIIFELLSLFPDGIDLEEFKRLTSKTEKKEKQLPLLITDRMVKALHDKSMIENNGGQLKHQSIIGRFAQAMIQQRKDLAPLYRNAFFYNRRLIAALIDGRSRSSSQSRALKIFSSQQRNFLAAIRYCDLFEANNEELLDYLDDSAVLFVDICSLDGFVSELTKKNNLFQGNERKCAEVILQWSRYYNGEFDQSFAVLQCLLPLGKISSLNREIVSEELLAENALDIYIMEGNVLWAAEYSSQKQRHETGSYPDVLLYIGEYDSNLAKLCQEDFFTFELLTNLDEIQIEKIDSYLEIQHEKNHIEKMQVSYTRAKLEPLPKEKIKPLVIVNPYTRGLKQLMLAFVESDTELTDQLYQEAAEHLWHIRYYHVEALYFHAKFLQQHGADKFSEIYQRGLDLTEKHHYRFLQYRFEELANPTGQPYDARNYPLPDNQDFSEYINFLIT